MARTFWVSAASGTNTNSGTNYANALKTIPAGLAKIATPQAGDTINVVADGVYDGTNNMTALSTGYIINSVAGTSWNDATRGTKIQGVDSSGNPAVAEIHANATQKYGYRFFYGDNYVWVAGLKFDYSDTTSGAPLYIQGQPGNLRITDCELWVTTNAATDQSTSGQGFPFYSGASSSRAGEMQVYNNVVVNGQVLGYSPAGGTCHFHHNIVIDSATNMISYGLGINVGALAHTTLWNNNTVYRYDANGNGLRLANAAGDVTERVGFYDNLLYVETGTSAGNSGYIVTGASGDAVATAAETIASNLVAIGPMMAVAATAWDTATATGVFSYGFNSAYRGGGSSNGTALNTGDVFNRTSGTGVFSDVAASYTWVSSDGYSHDLPMDLRPLLSRDIGIAGGVPGAIDDSVNVAPVVVTHTYTASPGTLLAVSAASGLLSGATDADGDTLTATVVSNVTHGSLTINTTDGSFDYTPSATYAGVDLFTYKANDGTQDSNTSTVTLNVVNTAPSAPNRSHNTNENVELAIPASIGLLFGATDPDTQTLSVTGVASPANGTLSSYNTTTGSFVYTPDFGFVGTDSFTYHITDGITNSATITASLNVYAVSAPTPPEYLDTLPFFRPVLQVRTEFRYKSTKNRRLHNDLANYTEQEYWNETTHRVINLATNTAEQVTLGGVAVAQYLMVETDTAIRVSLDGGTNFVTVTGVLALAKGNVSTLHIYNPSTTEDAQVILTASD